MVGVILASEVRKEPEAGLAEGGVCVGRATGVANSIATKQIAVAKEDSLQEKPPMLLSNRLRSGLGGHERPPPHAKRANLRSRSPRPLLRSPA